MGEATYLLAGKFIDGSGGKIQENMLLKIEGGRFAAIERYNPAEAPPPEHLSDLSHCTILPPLVDSHVHLFMSGTIDRAAREHQLIAEYQELRPVISRHLHDLFSHGVLAVRDGGDKGGYALAFRQSADMHPGVSLKVVGRAWHAEGRYGGLIGRYPEDGRSLVAACMEDTEEVDQVKLVNSGFNSLKTFGLETEPQFTLEELTDVVAAAARSGRKVMVHANGREPVRRAVLAGCHSIEHGFFMGRENLQLMADKGTFWVPTVFTMKAFMNNFPSVPTGADLRVIEKNLNHQLHQLALARELGVNVALGTDAGSLGVLHGESLVEEMKLYMKAGYTLAETVRCAGENGARLLGLEDFGILAKGKTATFLVARGTPAQLPRKILYLEAIYVNGRPSPLYRKNPVKHVALK